MAKKIGYIVVALFLGRLGVHNFLENNTTSGWLKLLITFCSWGLFSGWTLGIIALLIEFWVLFDIVHYCIYGKSYDVSKIF